MRPIVQGTSPQEHDFADYRVVFATLLSQLGPYCSYCERRIPTHLAVEHIQPKNKNLHPELEGQWDNFLLACVNCNSTKGDQDVQPENYYLPDRDNTLSAFEYRSDGSILPRKADDHIAVQTLSHTGLDKALRQIVDENGRLVAADRISQRTEAWLIALRSKNRLQSNSSAELIESIVDLARSEGFFAVWITIFEDIPEMRRRFIAEFPQHIRCLLRPDNHRAHLTTPPQQAPRHRENLAPITRLK